MWHRMTSTKPESGKRIIALYEDGSGGDVFLVHDGGFLNEHGDPDDDMAHYDRWAYLPENFRLYFED